MFGNILANNPTAIEILSSMGNSVYDTISAVALIATVVFVIAVTIKISLKVWKDISSDPFRNM